MPSEAQRTDHHPTKERLIAAAVEVLTGRPDDIGTEAILEASGLTSGAIYHHFEDVEDLIETAHARLFSRFVDLSIVMIRKTLSKVASREEMIEALKAVTRATQGRELAPIRFERARIVAMAERNGRFRIKLEAEQDRLTDALGEQIAELQSSGWIRPEIDPRAGAVMIQAYTLGKVVDDVASTPMDGDAWNALIDLLLIHVYASPA